MTTIIYCPTKKVVQNDDDAEVANSIIMLKDRFLGAKVTINDGKAQLERLDKEANSKIYIVGHGNAGTKIGAHGHENSTAPELVEQLLGEGLPKQPKNLIRIHLYACCTATKVRKGYVGDLQEAFVADFCKALVKSGCDNYRVVAYVGFLCGKDGTYSINYHKTKADKREWLGGDKAEPLNVHYTVSGGAWQKLGNDNWVQQVEIRSHGFRKNSVVYSMSNAAN